MVYVDGAKTQGIESLMKAVKSVTPITGMVSAAHGKLFWFPAADLFRLGMLSFCANEDGYQTKVGMFSATHIDPGSALLSCALPLLSGMLLIWVRVGGI